MDELTTKLSAHLKHEESDGLPLIDSTLSRQQWQHFADVHRERIGADTSRYLPWLLDGAGEAATEKVLSRLPEWGQVAYRNEWSAAYAQLDLWTPTAE